MVLEQIIPKDLPQKVKSAEGLNLTKRKTHLIS